MLFLIMNVVSWLQNSIAVVVSLCYATGSISVTVMQISDQLMVSLALNRA